MKKYIRQIGTQVGLTFTKEDLKIYGIKVGDLVDLSDIHIISPNGFPSHDWRENEN